jgi:hypothetical protein
MLVFPITGSQDSSVGIAMVYGLRESGFDSRKEQDIFLFFTVPRRALKPTQPPIKYVTEALSPGVRRSVCEAGHSPPSNSEVKNDEAIPPLSRMS